MGFTIKTLTIGAPFRNVYTKAFSSLAQIAQDYLYIGSIGRDLSVAAGVLTFGTSPGGGDVQVFSPNQIACGGISQFSQIVYAANGGTAVAPTRPTLWLFATGQSSSDVATALSSGYALVIRNEPANNDALIIKSGGTWLGGGATTLATLATLAIPAIGDTVRFEGRIVNGTDVELTVKYNGAIVAGTPVTDAPGFINGVPGFGSRGNNSNVTTFGFSSPSMGKL